MRMVDKESVWMILAKSDKFLYEIRGGIFLEKRNLILVHLESVNMCLFNMHRELFPNINRIVSDGTLFENYFSTATSTIMAVVDLTYGTMYKDEKNQTVKENQNTKANRKNNNYSSVFEELKQQGYFTKGFVWPKSGDTENIKKQEAVGKGIELQSYSSYDLFMQDINIELSSTQPFAFFLMNLVSHISYRDKTRNYKCSFESWKESYKLLDDWIGQIWNVLQEKELLDNTVIVMYGDHGDDFWGHRFHNGYTHAIEPYSNMIQTPLIVYEPKGSLKNIHEELMSGVDIKNLIMQLLYKDVCKKIDRKYAYARNIYACQKAKIFSLGKGYSVTNGEYLLMVSVRGMELYNISMDYFNTCNLLDFFFINDKGKIEFRKNLQETKSRHFQDFFTKQEIRSIKKIFIVLKRELYLFAKRMYVSAGLNEEVLNKDLDFNKINQIHHYRFYNRNILDRIEK